VSKSIYIFNAIIFENIKERGFEHFQKSKSPRSTCAHVHMVLSGIAECILFYFSKEKPMDFWSLLLLFSISFTAIREGS
jgi:hypothetical protein